MSENVYIQETADDLSVCRFRKVYTPSLGFNPSNAELNPICHLLALLGAHHILHVSRIRVNYHKNFF
jgi:hypothetical protein